MEKTKMRIAFVDDWDTMQLAVKPLLESRLDAFVISFTRGKAALDFFRVSRVDIYIIDLQLRDILGSELISSLLEINPKAKIIIYTGHEGICDLQRMLEFKGVKGIVLKSSGVAPLVKAVQEVSNGNTFRCQLFDTYTNPCNTLHPDADLMRHRFSDLEMKVMQLSGDGYTLKGIAEELNEKTSTIDACKRTLFSAFGVNSMAQVLAIAASNGFPIRENSRKW